MSLEGPRFPQLHYARTEDAAAKHVQGTETDDTLQKALELARELEELLEDTRSMSPSGVPNVEDARAHSTRMARAFAASLVDELAALVRPVRHTGSS
jgi:hypothetical protein